MGIVIIYIDGIDTGWKSVRGSKRVNEFFSPFFALPVFPSLPVGIIIKYIDVGIHSLSKINYPTF